MLTDEIITSSFKTGFSISSILTIIGVILLIVGIVLLIKWGFNVLKVYTADPNDIPMWHKRRSDEFKMWMVFRGGILLIIAVVYFILTFVSSSLNVQQKAIEKDSWSVIQTEIVDTELKVGNSKKYYLYLDRVNGKLSVPRNFYMDVRKGDTIYVVIATKEYKSKYKKSYVMSYFDSEGYEGEHFLEKKTDK